RESGRSRARVRRRTGDQGQREQPGDRETRHSRPTTPRNAPVVELLQQSSHAPPSLPRRKFPRSPNNYITAFSLNNQRKSRLSKGERALARYAETDSAPMTRPTEGLATRIMAPWASQS